jgi:hypothetical protein
MRVVNEESRMSNPRNKINIVQKKIRAKLSIHLKGIEKADDGRRMKLGRKGNIINKRCNQGRGCVTNTKRNNNE